MATKNVKTRNPERRSGKAWGKGHSVEVKALSPEAKAQKNAKRIPVVARDDRGSSITMPRITWGWAGEVMAARWPNTRRVRMVDAVLAQKHGDAPPVIEPNPEARAFKKNGR